jgi:hypothetical protein
MDVRDVFVGWVFGKSCHPNSYHSSTLCIFHQNLLLHVFLLPLFDLAWCQVLINIDAFV